MTSDHDEQIGTDRPLVSVETRGRHPNETVNSSGFSTTHSAASEARSVIRFIGTMTTSRAHPRPTDKRIVAFEDRKWNRLSWF